MVPGPLPGHGLTMAGSGRIMGHGYEIWDWWCYKLGTRGLEHYSYQTDRIGSGQGVKDLRIGSGHGSKFETRGSTPATCRPIINTMM